MSGRTALLAGWLMVLVAGDLDGDGRDDLAGIGTGNTIWAMTDGATWHWVPGWATALVAGDFYGDGHAHLAALGWGNSLWRSPRLGTWHWVPGWAETLMSGDFDHDGRDDLAVIGWQHSLWVLRNGVSWQWLPGGLVTMHTDHTAAGVDDLVGWNGQCTWRNHLLQGWTLDGCGPDLVARQP